VYHRKGRGRKLHEGRGVLARSLAFAIRRTPPRANVPAGAKSAPNLRLSPAGFFFQDYSVGSRVLAQGTACRLNAGIGNRAVFGGANRAAGCWKNLEARAFANRNRFPVKPEFTRYEYALNEKGIALAPVLTSLWDWSQIWEQGKTKETALKSPFEKFQAKKSRPLGADGQ
jgi:hypothetical protein